MNHSGISIEVCIDSVESAIAAVNGGADRLELCATLGLGGGTTPSLGLFKTIQKAVPGAPIMVMIRPRAGDFLYSAEEFVVMLEDIQIFKAAGASGVVVGILHSDGTIDMDRTAMLAREAAPMQVCFHRAFDMTRDPKEAFEALSSIRGITRILTSGHGVKANSSLPVLQNLLSSVKAKRSSGRSSLDILPGSGVNVSTVAILLGALLPLGLHEIHLSGGEWIPSGMEHRREGMGMGVGGNGEWGVWRTNEEVVRQIRHIVNVATATANIQDR